MRRRMMIIAPLLVVASWIAIGAVAYNAGEQDGIAQGIEQVQVAEDNGQEVQVVHVVNDGRHGVFPGFFLFPLFLIGSLFLFGWFVRGGKRRGGGHGHGPGPWNDEGRRRFEERARDWHTREHGEAPPAPAV